MIRNIFFLFTTILLASCDQYRIEFDELIKGFHGETIIFNKPMIVLSPTKSHEYDFDSSGLGINRLILGAEEKYLVSNHPAKYQYEDVKPDEIFTIVASYWSKRHNWFMKPFGTDTHEIIVEDRNNRKSIMHFFSLEFTNHPEWKKFER